MALSAGQECALALRSDDPAACWGRNDGCTASLPVGLSTVRVLSDSTTSTPQRFYRVRIQ